MMGKSEIRPEYFSILEFSNIIYNYYSHMSNTNYA